MSEEDSNKEAKDATDPNNNNTDPGTLERQRRDRLEQNRISARESRKRKKTMIEELQRTVITLSQENKELNERNELLRRELVEIGTKHPGLVPINALMRGGALASATEETNPAADAKDESASSGAGGSGTPTTNNPLLPQPQPALSAPNAQQQMALMQQMMMMQQMNPAFMGMMQGMAAQQAAQAGQQPQPQATTTESDAAPAENGANPAESGAAPQQENPAGDAVKQESEC